ncbi:hypothetical protein PI125_g21400 [Phytophthora idaei]|nr:hypothetical protein PI125_g21400 [Phytophthora idaei]
MDPTLWIKDDKYFGENFHPVKGQVYVLVVVPKQWTSMPTVSKDGVFANCSDPFFSQFPTVGEDGDWLRFPSLLPLTKRHDLYIRASYRVIADEVMKNPDKSVIRGKIRNHYRYSWYWEVGFYLLRDVEVDQGQEARAVFLQKGAHLL